jgi:hypothetical protein
MASAACRSNFPALWDRNKPAALRPLMNMESGTRRPVDALTLDLICGDVARQDTWTEYESLSTTQAPCLPPRRPLSVLTSDISRQSMQGSGCKIVVFALGTGRA